jgi:hypothetical protein
MQERKDKNQKPKLSQAAWTVKVIRQWAEVELKKHEEVSREGIPKGTPIGFSLSKRKAALMMVLFPFALKQREIAKEAGVSEGVLRVWKTQSDFVCAVKEACEKIAQLLIDTLEVEIMKPQFPDNAELAKSYAGRTTLGLEGKGSLDAALAYADHIMFLNPYISGIFFKWLKKKIDSTKGPAGFMFATLAYRLRVRVKALDEGEFRKWIRDPATLKIEKLMIAYYIDGLIEFAQFVQKEQNNELQDKLKERVKDIKEDIFGLIDTLAK